VLVTVSAVVVALVAVSVVALKVVEVALVVVLFDTVRPPEKVEEAETMMPTVVVGTKEPLTSSNAFPNRLADVR